MRRLLKRIIGTTADSFFFRRAKKIIGSLKEADTVFFFDIDNTIADTQGKRHLTGVKEFPEMISLVKESAKKGKVIFLSARNVITYRTTRLWLKSKGFSDGEYGLVFLTAPHKKIDVLKTAAAKNLKVIFYDDLCYNHECGEIKKYDDVISKIQELDIIYKGIEDFKHLQ